MLHMVQTVFSPPLPDMPVEADFLGQLRPGKQPAFAAGQPEIRQLGLPAVHQLLAEDAVFIQQGIAHGGDRGGGEGIQKAGGQSPQAAVAQPRIRLQLIQRLQLDAEFLQHPPGLLGQVQVIQGVFQRPAHEELHAQIVHLLGALLPGFGHVFHPAAPHHIPQDQRQGVVEIFIGGLLRLHRKVVQQLAHQHGAQILLRHQSGLLRSLGRLFDRFPGWSLGGFGRCLFRRAGCLFCGCIFSGHNSSIPFRTPGHPKAARDHLTGWVSSDRLRPIWRRPCRRLPTPLV